MQCLMIYFCMLQSQQEKEKLMKKYQLKVGREGQSESLNLALATDLRD